MPGLPFPSDPVYARENSFDPGAGTPLSNVDDVPIDPALNETPIDPAILAEEKEGDAEGQPQQYPAESSEKHSKHMSVHLDQYSLGPQGDPFAPPPPAYFVPEEPVHPPKPVKKKRKPRREPECGFCQGNDAKNKIGEPERMVSCDECGRSGHPSCMQLDEISENIHSYPWKCMECKNCEICQEKGDDSRILFCDFCDRGWHMDCLDPPLAEEPPGKWHCPLCPPLPPDFPEEPTTPQPDPNPDYRESSAPSTSYSIPDHKGKGKENGIVTDDSDMDVDVDGEEHLQPSKSRKKAGRKSKARPRADQATPGGPSPRSTGKRMRIKIPTSPDQTPTQRRMVVRLRLPPRDKGKEKEDSDGEPPKGLFDDVLSVEERDTSKTTIEVGDKIRFERSRALAEAKLNPPNPPISEEPQTPIAGPSSRPLRSTMNPRSMALSAPSPGPSASPAPSTPATDLTKVDSSSRPLRIRTIRFGEYDIQTWYDAPFPEEYANISDGRLWICEFCLKYMRSRFQAVRHATKCKARHPPGDEIYRDGSVSIFEVDGRRNKIYCQNLCLLSKMFLDHKSLFYDVEPFLFYVITEVDDVGARFVGYFSKEKHSPKDYNVSCIMTLPVRQRRGWGNLLIDFSYLLSKKERRVGSPEKPLSSLGALSYRNYWTLAIMQYLRTAPDNPRLEDISAATSMTLEDIYNTLVQHKMITIKEHTPPSRPAPGQSIKFIRGRKNGVARRHLQRTQTQEEEKPHGPFAPPKDYIISWDHEQVDRYLKNWESKGYLQLKPEKLKWSPFLLTRTKHSRIFGDPMEQDPVAGPSLAKAEPFQMDMELSRPAAGPSTPRMDALRGSENVRTESPAAALFDGDVEVTDARSIPVTPSNAPAPVQNSSSPVPSEDEGSLRRGLRSLAVSTPKSPTARSLRTRAQSARTPVTSPALSRTRSAPAKIAKVKDVTNGSTILSDEALAAQLAREGLRQLRSRSAANVLQDSERKRAGSISSPRPVSPRKRRRIDSSPELDLPMNGQSSATVVRLAAPNPRNARRTSTFLNGSRTIPEEDAPALATRNEPDKRPSPAADVKSEDMSTPSTAVASRHSVPSEDTNVEMESSDPPDKQKGFHDDVPMANPDDGTTSDIDAEGELDAEGDPDDEAL